MKSLKALFTAVAAVAVVGVASAQPPIPDQGDRVFSFSPNAATESNATSSYNAQLNDFADTDNVTIGGANNALKTTIVVNEFLYVRAQLGGNWQVDGWGDGTGDTSPISQFLDVYHSDPVRLTGTGWQDPSFQGNTNHGADPNRVIPMTFSNTLYNAVGAQINNTMPPIAVSALNGPFDFSPDTTVNGTAPTLGHMRAEYDFQISPNETTYSGTYTMNPTLTFTNQ